MVWLSKQQYIRIYDTASGAELVSSFRGHDNDVALITFSPDGKWITPGSRDKSIRVCDALTWDEILHALHGHNHALLVDILPDGTWIVSGTAPFGSGIHLPLLGAFVFLGTLVRSNS
jgi:WD40 repeat protein